MIEWSYFLMVAFFISHELDAVKRHEWRVLPLTSFLPEKAGEQVFIWAHAPVLALLFALGGFDPRSLTALCFSAFSVVHVFLHIGFRNHPEYDFNNLSSWALIIGTGICGTAHLFALYL